MKLNLKDSVLDNKGKEEFLTNVEQFTDIFSLRDKIGTCPFIEVHLKLKDETPFFVRPYPMREEQKNFEIDFEIEPVKMPQASVPIDTPLSIIHKHIPRQSDIDKIVRNIETHVIHS